MCVYNVTFPFKYIKMPSCWCKIQAYYAQLEILSWTRGSRLISCHHLWCPRYDAADLCTHGSQLRPFSEVAPAPIFDEKARDSLWCKKHSWKQMLEAAERIIYGSTWSISTYKWESYCFPHFFLTSNLHVQWLSYRIQQLIDDSSFMSLWRFLKEATCFFTQFGWK